MGRESQSLVLEKKMSKYVYILLILLKWKNIFSFTGFCPWENLVYLFRTLSKCEDFTNGNHQ